MNELEVKQFIRENLDDTLEGLYYRLTMDTDLNMDDIKDRISQALKELGYGFD